MKRKGLFFLAVLPTFNKYRSVFLSNKYINPTNNSKAHKIELVIISEFILSAHNEIYLKLLALIGIVGTSGTLAPG